MNFPFAGFTALALTGFALCSTGCVTEYRTVSSNPSYTRTSLPAASRVGLVMEFREGEPTPEERAEVRALLADYLSGKGSVLVDDPGSADYLVHAVLERRNPENPSEWTVVNTYSARSLGAGSGDEYQWPSGLIEDDYYETTTFSYIGFGLFYPMWFDYWDSPWHRGRVVVCPPPRHHNHYWESHWRSERRWHRPDRWHGHRRPESNRGDQHRPDLRPGNRRDDDRRRLDPDDRHRGWRNDGDRRPETPRHDGNRRPEGTRRDEGRRDSDHRDTWQREAAPPSVVPSQPPRQEVGNHRDGGRNHGERPPSRGNGEIRRGPEGRPLAPTHTTGSSMRPPRPNPPTTPPQVVTPTESRPRAVVVPGHGVVPVRSADRRPPERREEHREQVRTPPQRSPHAQAPHVNPSATRSTPAIQPVQRSEPNRRSEVRSNGGGGERRYTPPPRRDDSGGSRRSEPQPRTKDDSDDTDRDRNGHRR